MNNEFIWPVRVYYEDTDAGGVVYYANYLKFYERARSEWLNQLKIDQPRLLNENIAFVVRKAEIDYIRPAKLNDSLQITTRIHRLRAVSIDFEQEISIVHPEHGVGQENRKQENKTAENSTVINRAKIKVACLNINSFIPCRIPNQVKEELQRVS